VFLSHSERPSFAPIPLELIKKRISTYIRLFFSYRNDLKKVTQYWTEILAGNFWKRSSETVTDEPKKKSWVAPMLK
jgi:hypothetical protein